MNKEIENEKDPRLAKQFFRTMRLMQRYMHQKRHGEFGDATRGQGRVLSILKMKPEITQKELGFVLDMRGQSLGELLTKLEAAGYITRTQSEEDRRVMEVKLTPEGAVVAEETVAQQHSMDELFDCLTEEEQANFKDYLGRMIVVLEEKTEGYEPQEGHRHGRRRHGRRHMRHEE